MTPRKTMRQQAAQRRHRSLQMMNLKLKITDVVQDNAHLVLEPMKPLMDQFEETGQECKGVLKLQGMDRDVQYHFRQNKVCTMNLVKGVCCPPAKTPALQDLCSSQD
jgi:hypothetical protein